MLLVLAALTAAYGLLMLVATAALLLPAASGCDPILCASLLGKPALVAAGGAALPLILRTRAPEWWARLWTAALALVVLAITALGASQILYPVSREIALKALAALLLAELAWRVAGARRRREAALLWRPVTKLGALAWRYALAVAVLGALLLWGEHRFGHALNRHGLASHDPGASYLADFRDDPAKDGYPVYTCRYNSLGYRDREPPPPRPGARRVLLVGDSYVLGDGIPTFEQTITAALQRKLDAAAPGAWQVMNAAMEGNGLYGYLRTVETLAPVLKPDVVVVGYLGDSDDQPFDVQRLVDLTPESEALRRLVVNARARQYVHETSMRLFWRVGSITRMDTHFDSLMEALGRAASRHGARLVILEYLARDHGRLIPKEATVVELPEELRYPGYRNSFWYERDFHPKPPLNERLAEILAKELTAASPKTSD